MVCIKCIYESILIHEGRQNALRFFDVAKSELRTHHTVRDKFQKKQSKDSQAKTSEAM